MPRDVILKSNYKFVALVFAVVLLVAVTALVSMQIYRQVETAAQTQKETQGLLVLAAMTLGELSDAEASQRGYVLSNDETSLEPYLSARDRIPTHLADLIAKTSSPAALAHLNELRPLVTTKLAQLAQSIELSRAKGARAALDASGEESGNRSGKSLMDSIRAEVRAYVDLENAALVQHGESLQSSMRHLFALIVTASLLTLLLAIFFGYQIYRESQHQIKALLHIETERLLAVQEDVNKQLQATNINLHISEERLAVTLDSIDDAVIATDAAGRVTLLNPLAERLTGWTRLEAAKRPVEEVFHIINADTRKRHPVPIRETLAHGTTLGLANHTIVIARDGSERDIADSCAPIRGRDGHVVGAVLVFRDVTERKKLDQALRKQNSDLEAARVTADKANLAKSDFLSNMSHELRTPLSAILGFAQLLDSGSPAPNDSQKRSLEQILKAGWYLLDLINEILDLALIESGKLSLSMEPISLTSVMLECEAMIEPQAQKRAIRMTFPTLDGPHFLMADRTRVKQVLINLLSNAIKYNSVNGSVVVTCEETSPQRLRISVKDTGAGLTREQITQLFQPFNRLGRAESAEEGTGIGLVMAKRLVELMGGAIGVESSASKGCVFWVELCITAAPALRMAAVVPANDSPSVITSGNSPRRKLLYVEDNPANLMLMEDIIKRQPDIWLISALDGITGIRVARESLPDTILMDINLPGINGINAMRILAQDPATAHIPVIALSANAMPADIANGLEAGFFRYLTKPINVGELLETLEVAFTFAAMHSVRRTRASTDKESQ